MAKRKRVQLEERDGVVGKECTRCGDWKSLEGFSNKKGGLGGRRSDCRECAAAAKKKYQEENHTMISERNRKYYAENRGKFVKYYEENYEKIIEQKRKYREVNPEYRRNYYASNLERHSENARKWRRNNLDKVALIQQRRRARKLLLSDVSNSYGKFSGGCVLTGENDTHWDHAIPLSTGHGGTTSGNMIPLRGDLNISKHDNNIFEWFAANRQRFELSQARFDRLIAWLASANALTTDEYREFVYWCHANKREVDEIKRDQRHSIEIWREAAGKQFPLPAYTETYYANEDDRKEVS
ncbi:hypothetical protein GJU41_11695 [Bacillus idriensis]|uniref:HNH endonuclease n=1 Tax=Metabacillus idriensis TaxID=324768 RepID=A0A6I2M8K6_9BACI|nr:hypothetical protein [Metabacillus idriensis]MRX54635.1 hypothetical protein [Metabacillus idriensis]